MELSTLKHEVAVSLYYEPCDINDLLKRDFLKFINHNGVKMVLYLLEKDKWVYEKDNKYYCTKIAKNHINGNN